MINAGILDGDADQTSSGLIATDNQLAAADIALQEAHAAADAVAALAADADTPDLAAMPTSELYSHLNSRVTADEYSQLLHDRDAARTARDAAADAFKHASETCDDSPEALEQLAEARLAAYDAHCDYLAANAPVEAYKDATAQVAAELAGREPLPEWEGDTLGNCTKVGEYESGSREWLEARQSGIGGSDVGAILGVNEYSTSTDVKNSKLSPITDEEVEAQQVALTSFSGAVGRGNAWEPVVAKRFATDHPDLTVMTSKATWRNDDVPHAIVNVDGVISSDGGKTVDGILEIKTASDASQWVDGPPPTYRAQVASYLHSTGMSYGMVAVSIDDREVRYYRIGADDPVTADGKTIADHQKRLSSTWERWQTEKMNPPGPKPNKGKFGWVKNPGSQSSYDKNATTARDLAAYRGISQEKAATLISDAVYSGKQPDQAVRDLYSGYDPAKDPGRRYVTVDFETNSRSAAKGQIIQTGAVVTDGTGKVLERIDSLHGIDPRIRDTQGTGASNVHQITPDMVDGASQFTGSAQHQRLKTLLSDPNATLVAHNASFEKTWLRAHGIATPRIIDTMRLRHRFDHGTVGSTNKDFVEANGVEYINGHNAAADADMTSRGLHGFMRRLQATPYGFEPKGAA